MDDLIKSFVASLGASGIVFGAVLWWLHKYLDRSLTSKLNVFESKLTGVVTTANELRKLRLKSTAEFLPLLQKSASECRMSIQEMQQSYSDRALQRFISLRESFIDTLYGSQLLLEPKTYDVAHAFKRVLDRLYAFLPEDRSLATSETIESGLETALSEIDALYKRLQESLRNDLLNLERVPGGGGSK